MSDGNQETPPNRLIDQAHWKYTGKYTGIQSNQDSLHSTDTTANTASGSNDPIYALNEHDRAVIQRARQEEHISQGREHKAEEALIY